ncbi:MAG TPA: HAMP domain-containing sensor histidine kinase, partial [Thermodesulfobacteriota bacterium]
LAPEAARRGVSIVVEPAPPVLVRATADAVAVIIGNLLDNAVKFSPPGGRVAVHLDARGGRGRVAVADQGPGIAPGDRARVFERFYRGDPSRAPGSPGVGLGLAIAQALARAHGGRIEVGDTPGGGATFTLDLPLAA